MSNAFLALDLVLTVITPCAHNSTTPIAHLVQHLITIIETPFCKSWDAVLDGLQEHSATELAIG